MRRFLLGVLVVVVGSGLVVFAQSQNWKKQLETDLKALYPQTQRSNLDQNQVTKAGVVLVVRKENIMTEPVKNFGSYSSKVRDGNVLAPGGTGAFFSRSNARMLKVGDRLYCYDISIADDSVKFSFLTAESYDVTVDGSTKPTRMRSVVEFELPKEKLPKMTAADVKTVVDAVVATDSVVAAANTKTIELGQTFAQVEAILGKPDTIVKLGARTIYNYKNMKLTFTDGKLTDVQ